MSNPVLLLRAATIASEPVELLDGMVVIGKTQARFPEDQETSILSRKGHYSLSVLYHLVKTRDKNIAQYIKLSQKEKWDRVGPTERPKIIQWLTGEASELDLIDQDFVTVQKEETQRLKEAAGAGYITKDSAEWTVQDIFDREKPICGRTAVLQTSGKTLTSILETYDRVQKSKTNPKRKGSRDYREAKRRKGAKPGSNIPIIVVPAAVTSILTLANVKDFLGAGIFHPNIDPEGKAAASTEDSESSSGRHSVIEIQREQTLDKTKNCTYHVIDDIGKLKKEDWERVVCVFVTGAKWQLSQFPWKSPAAIFDKVLGCHLYFEAPRGKQDDVNVHPNVKGWKISKFKIAKTKRYQDRGVVMDFWRLLTGFIREKKKPGTFLY